MLKDGVGEELPEGGFADGDPLRLVDLVFQTVRVFCDVTYVFDGANVDGVGAEALLLAVAGEGVEEAVGGRVVALAFFANEA